MDKKLNEAVAALRPQMVAALQRLVRRRSVEADPLPGKPFGEEVDACFAEALALCHELGFETTDMDRYIGWCEIGTGDEMVAVLGHLDVVPEGEGWHHPPKCIGGGTYAKMLPNVVAFGPLFAGDPVTEHQPDECIDLERLVQNAQIIANAIVKLANLPLE